MNKYIRILIIFIVSIVFLSIFINIIVPDILDGMREVKRRNAYSSWKELVSDSEYIVIGKVGEVIDTVKIDGLRFIITEIDVQDNIKAVMPVEKFHLLQTSVKEDPIVKRNDTVLLFLYQFEGPQTDYEFTYACRGMFDGQFIINDNIVRRSYLESGTYDNAPKELSGEEIWGVNSYVDNIVDMLRKLTISLIS